MAKSKYVALGLSVVLAFSLVSCGKQTQEPPAQEPEQKTQQVEPVSIETPTPVEVKPENPAEAKPLAEVDTPDTVDEANPVDETEPVETAEIQLFNDCNEVVYATGSVNIRASWSANSEKLGSLSAGQSVTRTGTSISGTKAEGWSRVELSDGSTAYISNKYLSTTKPVVQQPSQSTQTTKPAQNTQTTKPAQSSTQEQTPAPAPSDPYAGMTPAERRQALLAQQGDGMSEPGNTQWTDEQKAEIGKRLNGG